MRCYFFFKCLVGFSSETVWPENFFFGNFLIWILFLSSSYLFIFLISPWLNFQEIGLFFSIVKFMSIKLLIVCPYYLFNGSRISSASPYFIPDMDDQSLLSFYFLSFSLSVYQIYWFFKTTFLFYTLFSYSIPSISAAIFIISFLLLSWFYFALLFVT